MRWLDRLLRRNPPAGADTPARYAVIDTETSGLEPAAGPASGVCEGADAMPHPTIFRGSRETTPPSDHANQPFMWLADIIDAFRRPGGWRGPAAAALFACLAGLPGLLALPPLDRDEARFAQATSQMLEQDDYVVIRFQDQPRFKKPVGIHWMQAAAVSAFGDAGQRDIRLYRIPSLLGAMLAAAACSCPPRPSSPRRTPC